MSFANYKNLINSTIERNCKQSFLCRLFKPSNKNPSYDPGLQFSIAFTYKTDTINRHLSFTVYCIEIYGAKGNRGAGALNQENQPLICVFNFSFKETKSTGLVKNPLAPYFMALL